MAEDGTDAGLSDQALDALESQIDAARAADDPILANRLYQRQQGIPDAVDPYGVADSDHDADTPDPADIQGLPGDDPDAYEPWDALTEAEKDEEFDKILEFADPEMARRLLHVAWPSDFEANIAFADAALASIPGSLDALRVLEAAGLADHPAFVKFLAGAGRLMAGVAGDPTTIPTTQERNQQVSNTENIRERIDELQEEIERAQSRNDRSKANRLYAEQQKAYRRLPGGTDPVIGESGRTT